jgi:type IV pilus biogenesis protein CpaD/CtpE
MTPPPPTLLEKQDVESFHHRYTVEHDTFININVPNSANQTTASGIFSFGQLSKRDESNA